MTKSAHKPKADSASGILSGIAAYTIWGLFPIYFVLTKSISSLEILGHRIIWAVPFGLLIILLRRQFRDVIYALRNRKTLGLLMLAAIALSLNWGVYIWAVQNENIFQGSLGYYINPLMYVLVGVVFFNEELSRFQGLAVLFASIGVLVLTLYGGQFPYIALILGVSFTLYGVIRSQVDIGAMPGLFIETILLFPIAAIYFYWLNANGNLEFMSTTDQLKGLLILAGPITVIPLLAFAYSARRLRLSTLGFLQYIGPTLQFCCALYYGEPFRLAHAACFAFIWAAVILFSWDKWRNTLKKNS